MSSRVEVVCLLPQILAARRVREQTWLVGFNLDFQMLRNFWLEWPEMVLNTLQLNTEHLDLDICEGLDSLLADVMPYAFPSVNNLEL